MSLPNSNEIPPPWHAADQAIRTRLASIRALADGTILTKISGPHFVVITKEGSEIRLWLMEQGRPGTGVVQSEMDLDAPLALLEGYTQAMTLALLWNPSPRRVFFSGLGGGRVPLVLHALVPAVELIAAEIDPEIIALAARCFGLDVGNRIHVAMDDGRRLLEARPDSFDAIVVDVFLDNGYTPYRQATTEFYRLCRSRLEPDGVLVINLLETDPFTARKIASLAHVFAYVHYLAVDEENTVVFASDNPAVQPHNGPALARQLDKQWRLPFPFVDMAFKLSDDLSQFGLDGPTPELLYDDSPPPGYFDSLPSLSGPFGRTDNTWPCPCGSGLPFGICHGNLG